MITSSILSLFFSGFIFEKIAKFLEHLISFEFLKIFMPIFKFIFPID